MSRRRANALATANGGAVGPSRRGARRVIVAIRHGARGKPKIVRECALPITSVRPVDIVVTELAVIMFPDGRATLAETAPDASVEQMVVATAAELAVVHLPCQMVT